MSVFQVMSVITGYWKCLWISIYTPSLHLHYLLDMPYVCLFFSVTRPSHTVLTSRHRPLWWWVTTVAAEYPCGETDIATWWMLSKTNAHYGLVGKCRFPTWLSYRFPTSLHCTHDDSPQGHFATIPHKDTLVSIGVFVCLSLHVYVSMYFPYVCLFLYVFVCLSISACMCVCVFQTVCGYVWWRSQWLRCSAYGPCWYLAVGSRSLRCVTVYFKNSKHFLRSSGYSVSYQ